MLQLVVLDMAGTTVEDPDGVGRSLKAALTAAQIPWKADEVNGIMGIPKPVAIATLMEKAGMPGSPEQIDAIHRDFQARMKDYYLHDPEVKEIAGAQKVLTELRNHGIKVVLDTGFDRSIVDILFSRLGWTEGVLDASVTSDEVERGRPYPDLIYRAMDLVGVTDPKNVAKVGDTPSDLGEGTAAGCGWVIGVTYGTHSRAQLAAHRHTHLIDSIQELPSLLRLPATV